MSETPENPEGEDVEQTDDPVKYAVDRISGAVPDVPAAKPVVDRIAGAVPEPDPEDPDIDRITGGR
jgi:hypothetical protein